MKNYAYITAPRKFIFHPIVRILLGTLAILIATFLVKEFVTKPILLSLFSEQLALMLVPLLGVGVMVGVYYLLIRYFEKKPFTDFNRQHAIKETMLGLGMGLIIIILAVALMHTLGYYHVISVNQVYSFLPTMALIFGVVVLEELVFRGLVFTIIENWKGSTVALFASSLIFQVPHFMNPHEGVLPATLGVLFGMATALMYMDTRKLWLPIAFHFSWNIAQPILGTTLSGIGDFDVLLVAQIEGPELITGSEFGVEDSLVAMLALVALNIYYYFRVKKKNLWVKHSKR